MLMSHLQQSISHADIPTKVGHVFVSFQLGAGFPVIIVIAYNMSLLVVGQEVVVHQELTLQNTFLPTSII